MYPAILPLESARYVRGFKDRQISINRQVTPMPLYSLNPLAAEL
jgi:hypothetical protein